MSLIGDRLREARERKNLKQTQVKTRTGINNKTLSGYENGVSEPDLETIKILADLYEVSVDWLSGRSDVRNEMNFEAAQDLIRFLTSSETTIDGKPIPKEFINDIVGYVRIRMAMDKRKIPPQS